MVKVLFKQQRRRRFQQITRALSPSAMAQPGGRFAARADAGSARVPLQTPQAPGRYGTGSQPSAEPDFGGGFAAAVEAPAGAHADGHAAEKNVTQGDGRFVRDGLRGLSHRVAGMLADGFAQARVVPVTRTSSPALVLRAFERAAFSPARPIPPLRAQRQSQKSLLLSSAASSGSRSPRPGPGHSGSA